MRLRGTQHPWFHYVLSPHTRAMQNALFPPETAGMRVLALAEGSGLEDLQSASLPAGPQQPFLHRGERSALSVCVNRGLLPAHTGRRRLKTAADCTKV